MLAFGSVVAGVGVLLVGLLSLLFRNPRAPRWTQPELVVFLTMVPVAGMIGLGLGYVLYGGSALLHGRGDVRELAVVALVPVVVALIWHVLGIKARVRAYAEASGQPPQSAVPGNPPRPPTKAA